MNSEQFQQSRIREAAYFLALEENFAGDPVHYWLAAEAVINRKVNKSRTPYGLKKLRGQPEEKAHAKG